MSERPRLTPSELEDWTDSGASWRVVALDGEQVTVELCACTGEAVDVREGAGPELVDYVRAHRPQAD